MRPFHGTPSSEERHAHDKRVYLGPGESFCIRRGQTHEFVNMGPGDARFLAVATPGLFGRQYFR
jgi:mannose-6-phosphate isomerase-like protein (cupin superfamily)